MKASNVGYIQKIEPFGTVDGPGIRTILFLSGCPLRCLYCHNPETWQAAQGQTLSAQDVLDLARRYLPYYGNTGGITFSGGEPLNQPVFLLETLKLLKEHGIHTTLDTSGYSESPLLREILANTDLVIYDLKAASGELYEKITSRRMEVTEAFLALAQEVGTQLWVRQVLVPGLNDTEQNFEDSAQRIAKLRNVAKVEILPYHTLGKTKYEKMGLSYPLQGTQPMPVQVAEDWQKRLMQRVHELRTSDDE